MRTWGRAPAHAQAHASPTTLCRLGLRLPPWREQARDPPSVRLGRLTRGLRRRPPHPRASRARVWCRLLMSSDDELSPYELQRRQNIAANAAHLRTLDLGPDHASTRALAPKQPRKQQTPRPSSAPRTQPVRITRNSSPIYREAPATPRSSVRRGTIDVTSHQRAEPSSHRAAMNIGQSSPAPLPARWGARVPHYVQSQLSVAVARLRSGDAWVVLLNATPSEVCRGRATRPASHAIDSACDRRCLSSSRPMRRRPSSSAPMV